MNNKSRFSILISVFIFILINSCDDNKIILDSDIDSGIEYFEQSFILNQEKSIFNRPEYHINDSLFNQSLNPKLYLGNIEDPFGGEISSYVLFQIDYNIINNYSICDTSLLAINDIKFTLKFDDSIYENGHYMPNNDFYGTGGHQTLNFGANYDFDNIEEDVDLYQTPFYINPYFYDSSQLELPLENNSNFYNDLYIQNLVSDIKQQNLILPNSRSSDYKVDLGLTDFIDIENWCGNDLEPFYILLEYNPPINDQYEKNLSIVSTDNYYGAYQPKLKIEYEKQVIADSLIGSIIDIQSIQNSTMVIESTDSTDEIVVPTLTTITDIYLLDDEVSLNNVSGGDNIVAINTNNSSSEFGMFLGYQSPDILSPPIIPITESDIELFDIEIEIDPDFDSDSIRFYFSDIVFGYQNVNSIYDFGEIYEDYGLDQCINNMETGDSLLASFNSEDFCLCGMDVGSWSGAACNEGNFTNNSWDAELLVCFKDNNGDLVYSLCDVTETAYNPDGTENNGILDWNDDGDGIWQEGEGEEWLDLGLDWLKGTTNFGVDDEYETGCKTPSYPNGIGYQGDESETYELIVAKALDSLYIDSEDFYSFFYNINDGTTVEFCGPQFWENPLIEGVSSCLTCNKEDPNGDNRNTDPSLDDWKNDLCNDCNDNGEWNFDDTDQDGIIDINEEYEPLEGNEKWDWIDVNNNGIFDYCLDNIENNPDCDYGEPFLDYGINQLPDNLEGLDFANDNYDVNPVYGTENNLIYDLGEQFFDTGIDGLYSYQEDNYNSYGKQGNNQVDFDSNDNSISEFKDYGLDNCPNNYESNDGFCDDSMQNLYIYDLHFDDYDIDPNNDNYTFNNIFGTENNNLWDYDDHDNNGLYSINEEIIDEYLNEEDCLVNNNTWEGTFCYIDSNEDGEYSITESSETFFEYENPLIAFVNVGQNVAYYNLSESVEQVYDKPVNDPIYGQDVFLWISKINYLDNNKYSVTISINSFIDVKGFQFKLNHGPYYEQIESIQSYLIDMIAYDFDDSNDNNEPDSDEINENIKYIHDLSLYPVDDSLEDPAEIILSNAYGMMGKLHFDDLNIFLNDNNQSIFIGEQQTYLALFFDTSSDYHNIDESGVQINFTGSINDLILIEDFVSPQIIYDDTEEILVPIGTLVNEILENSNQIFSDSNEVLDAIMYHLEISLDSYSNIFNTAVIDSLSLPQIDIFYSE